MNTPRLVSKQTFDRVKMSLGLATIGEVLMNPNYRLSHQTVKYIDACNSYEEYKDLVETAKTHKYTLPVTNAQILEEIRQLRWFLLEELKR